jgi:hypothetical protein
MGITRIVESKADLGENLPLGIPGCAVQPQQRTRKDNNVMADYCHNLANEIQRLIAQIPPPDIRSSSGRS